jgi:hypothetical protein
MPIVQVPVDELTDEELGKLVGGTMGASGGHDFRKRNDLHALFNHVNMDITCDYADIPSYTTSADYSRNNAPTFASTTDTDPKRAIIRTFYKVYTGPTIGVVR